MNKYRFGIRVALDAIRHLREENINFNDNRKSYNDRKHLLCLYCFRNVKQDLSFKCIIFRCRNTHIPLHFYLNGYVMTGWNHIYMVLET